MWYILLTFQNEKLHFSISLQENQAISISKLNTTLYKLEQLVHKQATLKQVKKNVTGTSEETTSVKEWL